MRFAFLKKKKEPFCKLRTVIRQLLWIYYLEFADISLIFFPSLVDLKQLKTKQVKPGLLISNVYIVLETAFWNDIQYYNL